MEILALIGVVAIVLCGLWLSKGHDDIYFEEDRIEYHE